MRALILIVVSLALIAGAAMAQDLGNRPPVKLPPGEAAPAPIVERQGGDTIFTAFTIPALPFAETGTTVGYNDDYDEMCPYGGMGPDVVYRFASTMLQFIDVDLCGSDYDTKIIIYDAAMHFVACNDDFYFDEPCGVYVSKLEHVSLGIGVYYIVIDGYGNSAGIYNLVVENPRRMRACVSRRRRAGGRAAPGSQLHRQLERRLQHGPWPSLPACHRRGGRFAHPLRREWVVRVPGYRLSRHGLVHAGDGYRRHDRDHGRRRAVVPPLRAVASGLRRRRRRPAGDRRCVPGRVHDASTATPRARRCGSGSGRRPSRPHPEPTVSTTTWCGSRDWPRPSPPRPRPGHR